MTEPYRELIPKPDKTFKYAVNPHKKEGMKMKVTDIKLHDPIRAIAELNKMEGAYAPEKHQIADVNGPVEIVVRYSSGETTQKREREKG